MSKMQTYPTGLTDEQWQLIRPLLSKRNIGKAGRPRTVEQRDVLDAIFYILRSGCPWGLLPHDFPPWGTVSSQFYRWRKRVVTPSNFPDGCGSAPYFIEVMLDPRDLPSSVREALPRMAASEVRKNFEYPLLGRTN